jgi:hypothetical protein
MFRPMIVAPMPASDSSTTAELSLTSPPGRPCGARQTVSGKTHSCMPSPPIPSGFVTLWSGPATKPSRDIEILEEIGHAGFYRGGHRGGFPALVVQLRGC